MSQPVATEPDAAAFRPHLATDETLLWTGRPDPAKWLNADG